PRVLCGTSRKGTRTHVSWSQEPELLGLPVLLLRDRNDLASVRCIRGLHSAQENRNRSRPALLHLQRGSASAGDQLGGKRYRQSSSRLLKSGSEVVRPRMPLGTSEQSAPQFWKVRYLRAVSVRVRAGTIRLLKCPLGVISEHNS